MPTESVQEILEMDWKVIPRVPSGSRSMFRREITRNSTVFTTSERNWKEIIVLWGRISGLPTQWFRGSINRVLGSGSVFQRILDQRSQDLCFWQPVDQKGESEAAGR